MVKVTPHLHFAPLSILYSNMAAYMILGDLFEYSGPDVYLIHQTNCQRQGTGAGLAKEMFERFPCADTYLTRKNPSTPGTNDIFEDPTTKTHIVNMNAQDSWKPYAETKEQREAWFAQCLKSLDVPKGSKLYFPGHIGCGLAKGDWRTYLKMITKWAQEHPELRVSVVMK